jgi:hypothetical protein
MFWLCAGLAVIAAAFSAYGWWFHFAVGPAHGPGMELGIVGAVVASVLGMTATWLRRRRHT